MTPPGSPRRYRHEVDRRFLRPGWLVGHLLVFAAALTCLRLGWWQWDRTQETTGTAQNFGYALLWPGFAVAFVYMWVRFLHLEVLKDAEDDEQTDRELREILAEGGFEPTDNDDQPPDAAHESAPNQPEAVTGNEFASGSGGEPAAEPVDAQPANTRSRRRADRQRPSQAVTISVATVGDDDDNPELTAYNQALAAMAEEDRRRAR